MANWLRPLAGGIMSLGGNRRLGHLVRACGARSGQGLKALIERRDAYRKKFDEAVAAAGADVLLCPPSALPALVHRASGDLGPASVNYTALYNLLAWPAGVVPVTRVRAGETSARPVGGDGIDKAARRVDTNSTGLPIGVQVAARPQRDDLVVAVMAAIEEGLRGSEGYPTNPPI
jgi:fatty acid amide hydrolase